MPTPLKAIKKKCKSCCGGLSSEVKNCSVDTCELFYYRFGKNPNIGLAKAREAKT